jgi:hypothetical protein
MKQFIKTKFFRSMQEASQKGVDIDAQVLKNGYDEFVILLFSKNATSINRVAHHDRLVYTRVELESLTGVSGKKCIRLPEEIHQTC